MLLLACFVAVHCTAQPACGSGTPIAANPDCPYSQIVEITLATYDAGKIYTGTADHGISCNNASIVAGDGALLCTGNLPYGANLFLAFSGTQNKGDDFADMEAFPTTNSNIPGNIFSGFNSKFMEWKMQIDAWIPKCDPSQLILIGGHSLGGAIAHLAGTYLAGKGCSIELITIGEPAAFMQPFPEIVTSLKHTRLVTYYSKNTGFLNFVGHYVDPVPSMTQVFGYQHPPNAWEMPLYKVDQGNGKVTYSNSKPNVLFQAFLVSIHLGCAYMEFTDQSICSQDNSNPIFKV